MLADDGEGFQRAEPVCFRVVMEQPFCPTFFLLTATE